MAAREAASSGAHVLRHYEGRWLRSDVLAGLTVGALVVPQSMAYADLADVSPQVGLYAALAAVVAYALLGTSRHLGVGPEPGTAVLAAAGVAGVVGTSGAADPTRYAALMAALALLVGAFCVVASALRLGFLADLLSRPVLVGYITGVAITLFVSQLTKVTAIPVTADHILGRLRDLATGLDRLSWPTSAIGAVSLAALLLLRRARPTWPAGLLVVAAATTAAAISSLDVALVGEIPGGLPTPRIPDVDGGDFAALVPTALGVALVGFSDNVLTARAIAVRQRYQIGANRELLGLGASNVAAGLFGGMPLSSSASRSAVGATVGGRTQLAGLVAGGVVAVTLVGLRSAIAKIPQAVLGALILAAAISIIDVTGLRDLWRRDRTELALAIATTVGVVVTDVLIGVLVALALSVLVALHRIARPHDALLGAADGLGGWVPIDTDATARPLPGLLVYRFDAPLFFANATRYRERLAGLLDTNPGEERMVVLDLEGVGSIDITAADALAELADELVAGGVMVLAVARPNEPVVRTLRAADLLAPTGPYVHHPTINSAVDSFRQL